MPSAPTSRCQGLSTLSEIALANTFRMIQTNNELLDFNNADYRELVLLFEFGEIHPWHKEVTSRIEAVALVELGQMKTAISIIFAFSVLYLFLVYFLLVPLENQINTEVTMTTKQLLIFLAFENNENDVADPI